MLQIKCAFSDFLEVINKEYSSCAVYIDLDKASLETYDDDEAVEKGALIQLPYQGELYDENSALGDYIWETDISIPHRMSARQYLRQNGLFPDFYSFYDAESVTRLEEWFKKREFEIVFDA